MFIPLFKMYSFRTIKNVHRDSMNNTILCISRYADGVIRIWNLKNGSSQVIFRSEQAMIYIEHEY